MSFIGNTPFNFIFCYPFCTLIIAYIYPFVKINKRILYKNIIFVIFYKLNMLYFCIFNKYFLSNQQILRIKQAILLKINNVALTISGVNIKNAEFSKKLLTTHYNFGIIFRSRGQKLTIMWKWRNSSAG